jgi:hypothetical protein
LAGGCYTILEELYPSLAQAAIGLLPTLSKLHLHLEINEMDNGLWVASYYRTTVSIYERTLLSPLLAFRALLLEHGGLYLDVTIWMQCRFHYT